MTAAASHVPVALSTVGSFLLWKLNDPTSARHYSEEAVLYGELKAAIDLIIIELGNISERSGFQMSGDPPPASWRIRLGGS
ncbi:MULTISPECIES: hypothetical protein [unclassified Bradyrhizobium]|uniref:hypothetical protein n=1 Tax=unclassified Bradyrhizobium TaxID=2631580 RepID=UPI002916631C|nr:MULTISPECIES: hypothetical protein [unclassified Bradyrhizobium]